jgi:hypothetical protein
VRMRMSLYPNAPERQGLDQWNHPKVIDVHHARSDTLCVMGVISSGFGLVE